MSDSTTWFGRDQIPMPLSLGSLADLAWVFLPDCRPGIIELVKYRLAFHMDLDEPVDELPGLELLGEVVSPVFRAVFSGRDDEALKSALRFLWLTLTYGGRDWETIQYDIRVYLLDWLMLPPYRDTLASLDADLINYIRSRFGDEW